MLGGGPYDVTTCQKCGSVMWNGQCENTECEYHWHPNQEEEEKVENNCDFRCR